MSHNKKFYTIYKTTNLITNAFYIGMHSTDDLNDGYLGSGKRLKYSINKYGSKKHNHKILEFCENYNHMKLRESQIVTEELLKEPLCLNLKVGGEGGFLKFHSAETKLKMSINSRRLTPSKETIEKQKATFNNSSKRYRTEEQKQKMRKPKSKEHIQKISGENHHSFGKTVPEERKEQIRISVINSRIKNAKSSYITPFGNFEYGLNFAEELKKQNIKLNWRTLTYYCRNNELIVSKRSLNSSQYLESWMIGKSFKDLGFSYLEKHVLPI
jgi:hypothetical protein